jgi:hypothetical protein
MIRDRQPRSQTWRTFLANHLGQVVAADFIVVPIVTCRFLFARQDANARTDLFAFKRAAAVLQFEICDLTSAAISATETTPRPSQPHAR